MFLFDRERCADEFVAGILLAVTNLKQGGTMGVDNSLPLLNRTLLFGKLLCDAAGLSTSVAVGHIEGSSLICRADMAGPLVQGFNKAPYVAQAKMAELVVMGEPEGLSMTPVDGFEFSLGWMGGVRYDHDLVGVSGLRQEHDRLFALILSYAMRYETRLHHVGYRHPTKEAAQQAAEMIGGGIEVPAPDHFRVYTLVPEPRSLWQKYWVEQQWFPEGPQTVAFHIDLLTQDPENLLVFVAEAFGGMPKLFDPGQNGPCGLYWVQAAKGGYMGVMARDHWWEVGT